MSLFPIFFGSDFIVQGGDGLVAREVLKYDLNAVHLVDLDPAMTDLFGEEGPDELQVSDCCNGSGC